MEIIEVKDSGTKKEFLRFPYALYRKDPQWIAPLEKDVEATFDKHLNPVLQHGEAIRWLLKDDAGKTIGRVAAFINYRGLENMEYPCGGMGFFECIDDKVAAFMLFDACRQWLAKHGMKAMEGPVNLGERDRFWGLMIESNAAPSYLENYNPYYYKKLFEEYGFREYFQQHTYKIEKKRFNAARLETITKWVMRKPEYSFRHIDYHQLDKFLQDFVSIYNEAWQKFENFKPVTLQEIRKIFNDLKPVLVEELIWFGYVNNEPAGFLVMLPDVNQLFKYVNGKLDLIGKLKFMFYRATKPITKLKALVFGIMPQYQNLGIDAAIIYNFYLASEAYPQYTSGEIAWVGGFNPKMHSLMNTLNGEVAKVHITYRKLFDESIKFEPYKLGEYKKG